MGEVRYRRGIPAARANLWVARIAAGRYVEVKVQDQPNQYDLMLYYGAFFIFTRSALEALRSSDAKHSEGLSELQAEYFRDNIRGSAVFNVLCDERHRIGHGDDAWAQHPMKSLGMVNRFIAAGHDWSEAVFSDDCWPEEPFKGQTIEVVMDKIWRSVSSWLDAIDALDEKRSNSA